MTVREVWIEPKRQLRDENAKIVVRWGRSPKVWFGSEINGGWCELGKAEMIQLRDALNEVLP